MAVMSQLRNPEIRFKSTDDLKQANKACLWFLGYWTNLWFLKSIRIYALWKMLSLKEKALLVKLFYQHNNSAAEALREFRKRTNVRRGPMSDRGVHKMIKKFEATGRLDILPGRGRKQVEISSVEDIATAAVDLANHSPYGNASLAAIANEVDMSISTVRKVMRQILRYYPYKIQRVQQLIQGDTESRLTFALQFLARMNVDDSWPWNILWSDEAHFYLNGQVNTHNCRIWAKENPHVVQEVPLHAAKVTVWCGFTATFLIGPYFFEESTPTGPITCSVNGRRYLNMLSRFVIPELQQRGCLQNTVFMQDGAPPHITRTVRTFLERHFTQDRLISRYFQTIWPPRSPDLTPCDFWLWGFLKDSVSKDKCQTISDLKNSIRRNILSIPRDTLRYAVKNTVLRMESVIENNGGFIEHA